MGKLFNRNLLILIAIGIVLVGVALAVQKMQVPEPPALTEEEDQALATLAAYSDAYSHWRCEEIIDLTSKAAIDKSGGRSKMLEGCKAQNHQVAGLSFYQGGKVYPQSPGVIVIETRITAPSSPVVIGRTLVIKEGEEWKIDQVDQNVAGIDLIIPELQAQYKEQQNADLEIVCPGEEAFIFEIDSEYQCFWRDSKGSEGYLYITIEDDVFAYDRRLEEADLPENTFPSASTAPRPSPESS